MSSINADKVRDNSREPSAGSTTTAAAASDPSATRSNPPITLSDCSKLNDVNSTDLPSNGVFNDSLGSFSSTKQPYPEHIRNQQLQQQEPQLLRHELNSNQSGSDSGLGGCTNSISSENSLIVNATGIGQTNNAVEGANHDNEYSNETQDGRKTNISGRLSDDAISTGTIDAALGDLSNNKIPSSKADNLSASSFGGSTMDQSDSGNGIQVASSSSSTKVKLDSIAPVLGSSMLTDKLKHHQDVDRAKQSSKPADGSLVTPMPVKTSTNAPDKIEVAHHDAAHRSQCSPSSNDTLILRSAMKKSVDTLVKSPKVGRNVSFNQTVIVFCEEIDTSSPSDFDPPIDYRDIPDCSERAYETQIDCDDDHLGASRNSSRGARECDLELLSKIVGEDACKLTDDQLFGLLENGSLLGDINQPDIGDDFTTRRLGSDQSYLCRDAISDTESESSMIVDDIKLAPDGRHQVTKNIPKLPTQLVNSHGRQQCHVVKEKDAVVKPSIDIEPQRCPQDKSLKVGKESNQDESTSEFQNRQSIVTSQKSLPARMRVTTVENQPKKGQHATTTSQDFQNHQSNGTAQHQQKVIHSQRENLTNLQPLTIKQSTIEQITISKPQILRNNVVGPTQQKQGQQIKAIDDYRSLSINQSHVATGQPSNQHSTASKNCCAQLPRPVDTSYQQQASTSTNANVESNNTVQTSPSDPACHICRAIESNQKLTNTTQPVNAAQAHNDMATCARAHIGENQQQINQHHGIGVVPNLNAQQQKLPQPFVTSQSCTSCREMIMRKQYGVSAGHRFVPSNIVPQPPRSIACQVVYVVDQNGNRIRALQVVAPSQTSKSMTGNPTRQIVIAPSGARLFNPSSLTGPQVTRPFGYTGQSIPNNFISNNQVREAHMISAKAHTSNAQDYQEDRFVSLSQNNQLAATEQRMPVLSQSAPKNHTIYYVRQPLGAQNMRQSIELSSSGAKTFPDAHEIRRLDGIRAPTIGPISGHEGGSVVSQGERCQNIGALSQQESNRISTGRRDEADDPSFGFSQRPAVKVFSSVTNQANGGRLVQPVARPSNYNLNDSSALLSDQANRQNVGSQTLDRKYTNRTQKQHQSGKDGIPNTSSMSNINNTLLSYREDSAALDRRDQTKSNGMNVKRWLSVIRYKM